MLLTKDEFLNVDLSERDKALLARAYETLEKNTFCGDYPWGNSPVISPWAQNESGLWNWDTAFHAVAVSRYDTALAKSCISSFIKFQQPNGMLPDVIKANGKHELRITKPPVLPWASWIVYERDRDRDFLRRCFDCYLKHEAFLLKNRCYKSMFFYSANEDIEKDNYLLPRWESGLDNSPRWDKPIIDFWPIDLNCYMVMFYRAMHNMAQELGEESAIFKEKEEKLVRLIEERLFCEEMGFYNDLNRFTGEFSDVLSPAVFIPLYIGIAPKERAELMHAIAVDKNKFFPGMPTVAYNDPEYSNNYWRGPTWLNLAYFALVGLKKYGYNKDADYMKEYLLDMIYENLHIGICENYDSVNRVGLFNKSFSWSAAFIIEFILGWDEK